MLLDKKQRPWATLFAIFCLAIVAIYFLDKPRHLAGPSGSTGVGLTFGVIGDYDAELAADDLASGIEHGIAHLVAVASAATHTRRLGNLMLLSG